jgi:hypothetical protein
MASVRRLLLQVPLLLVFLHCISTCSGEHGRALLVVDMQVTLDTLILKLGTSAAAAAAAGSSSSRVTTLFVIYVLHFACSTQ